MTTTGQQSEALRLADALTVPECTLEYGDCMKAGELLRAQHARIAELESQLEAIGAGGVEPHRWQCSRSHPHEEMTPMCELRTEIARLTNALARAEAAALPWPRAEVDDLLERLVSSHISSFIAGERGSNKPEAREFVKSALVEAAGFIRAVLHPLHPADGVPAQEVTKVQQTAPKVIHLNIGPDAEDCDFKALFDVTWCDHDASNGSIQYVRADLAATHPTQQGLDARTAYEAECFRWLRDEALKVWKKGPVVFMTDADGCPGDGGAWSDNILSGKKLERAIPVAAQAKQGDQP